VSNSRKISINNFIKTPDFSSYLKKNEAEMILSAIKVKK